MALSRPITRHHRLHGTRIPVTSTILWQGGCYREWPLLQGNSLTPDLSSPVAYTAGRHVKAGMVNKPTAGIHFTGLRQLTGHFLMLLPMVSINLLQAYYFACKAAWGRIVSVFLTREQQFSPKFNYLQQTLIGKSFRPVLSF